MNGFLSAKLLCLVSVIVFSSCSQKAQNPLSEVNPEIWIRPGYELSVVVNSDQRVRHMCFGKDGTLYFTTTPQSIIMAAKDKNNDGYFETLTQFHVSDKGVYTVLWYEEWLWYSESGAIYKLQDRDNDGVADEKLTVLADGTLPSGGGHHYRPLLIHNGSLYTGIGDAGNINDMRDTEREKIWTFNLEGKDKKLWCSGIRNTEKLVVRPGTDEIWGMDHGSDWFGREVGDERGMQPITDYNPPGEMNKYIEGGFYGHPFITGNRVPRYEYANRDDIIELAAKTIVPQWCAGAHWAPNGMMFYTGDQFPAEHKGDAFVAYHGSWNRSVKSGYQVTRVLFEDGKPYGEKPYVKFITDDQEVLGRPVDVIQAPDGTIFISEDNQNKIYKLKYVGENE
jgi:glucose/arabinose dehydrogenase